MASEKYVGTLGPGNAFREWLVQVLGERIGDRDGKVNVYRVMPASHTVCRYEFPASGFSVVAKFYGEHLSGTNGEGTIPSRLWKMSFILSKKSSRL